MKEPERRDARHTTNEYVSMYERSTCRSVVKCFRGGRRIE